MMSDQPTSSNSLLTAEQINTGLSPGVWAERCKLTPYQSPAVKSPPALLLTDEDRQLANELGHMSPDELLKHIRGLQDLAYQLGTEEAKQLNRGQILRILEPMNNDQTIDHFPWI